MARNEKSARRSGAPRPIPGSPTTPLVACDILYIHPAKQGVVSGADWRGGANPYPFIPVGIVGLANLLLSQGLTLRGLNHPIELLLDERFDLAAWLGGFVGVRWILIDLHWYEHAFGALDVARLGKRCHPEARVVLGGLTATAFAAEILTQEPAIDLIVRGDAEWPLMELVTAPPDELDAALPDIENLTYRRGAAIVSNPLTYCAGARELDTLNFADIAFLEHADAYARRQFSGLAPLTGHWLCIGRGCHHACSYCGGGRDAQRELAGRERVIVRSVPSVLRDIERLHRRGVHQVALNLDVSERGEAYWRALFEGLRARGLRIGLYNEFSALPPDGFIDEMAATIDPRASRMAFSPLSGSEAVRRRNGKHFTNAGLLATLEQLAGYGLLSMVYFSLNLPGEPTEGFDETIALARRILETVPPSMVDLLNMCHTLDPLSPMSTQPDAYGVRTSLHAFRDYYDYCRRTARGAEAARRGISRGFWPGGADREVLGRIADRWDREGAPHAPSWHPIPRTW